MANESIRAAFERMWQHIVSALGNKANKSDVDILQDLVGDTAVATQISEAISTKSDEDHTHLFIIEQNNGLEQKFWRGTQSEYDAIDTKDDNTMYIIVDDNGNNNESSSAIVGDMSSAIYDPQGKAQDIFAYVDTAIGTAIGGSY